jgi:hypothetical protein
MIRAFFFASLCLAANAVLAADPCTRISTEA